MHLDDVNISVFWLQNGNSDPILAAFCVECEMFDTKQSSYSNFRKLLRENVNYDIVRSVVGEMMEERSQGPRDLAPLTSAAENSSILSETVKLLKDKVEDRMPKITPGPEEIPKEITTLKLIPKKQAVWQTNLKGVKSISYQLTMSEDKMKGKEYFVFSQTFSAPVIELETDTEIVVRIIDDLSSCAAEINISNLNFSGSARLISNLSDLEQYFLHLGSAEEDRSLHLVVESEVLTKLFEQFEVKHGCRILLVTKLEQKEPSIYCSVEKTADWNTISLGVKDEPSGEYYEGEGIELIQREEEDCQQIKEEAIGNISRKHQNPDEIIDGRSKWTEMRFVRKRRLDEVDIEHEDTFDFDRLNPHRTFVQEFEDSFDNTDWAYNNTVLKMMADLNSEALVTLGDSRLRPDLEEKMLKEYEEWEKFKRENKHNYPQVKLKRLKSDKLVKNYKITKIVTKNLRKSPSNCSTPLYS